MDYNKVLEKHVETGADLTIVCKNAGDKADVSEYGVVSTDINGRVVDFSEEKPLNKVGGLISTGISYVKSCYTAY